MFKKLLGFLMLCCCLSVYAEPIQIVAAENFYGNIAQQIGGVYVQVTSILQNPRQDPHLFSSTPAIAKSIADAQIVVYNGLGYDDWINNLIVSSNPETKKIIVVGEIAGKNPGDNPHIWYDPEVISKYGAYLTNQLQQLDPAHQDYYQQQFNFFKQGVQSMLTRIQALQKSYHGTQVIATEPIFNDMAQAIGLVMNGQGFQISIMNNTEPSVADIQQFEDKLNHKEVKVLIFNKQVSTPLIERMKTIAIKNHIPLLGVTETEPVGVGYFAWMVSQLNTLGNALNYSHSH